VGAAIVTVADLIAVLQQAERPEMEVEAKWTYRPYGLEHQELSSVFEITDIEEILVDAHKNRLPISW